MQEVIRLLKEKNLYISTMESCTGGGVVNALTNVEGASEVLKYSAVTYSNEFKIKMGVSEDIINKYSVYSIETAKEMAKSIVNFTNSDLGVGITGKLNRVDNNNLVGDNNRVFISIYDKNNDNYYNKEVVVDKNTRSENKLLIIDIIKDMLLEILSR
ncbi:MAG: CinA family protein [Bacilli bacterium]|nr:CinA family protein [Bacilli bacterium]